MNIDSQHRIGSRHHHHHLAALGLVTATALALSGCTGGGNGEGGDTLRVAMVGNGTNETFNPAIQNTLKDYAGVYQVFETLTKFKDGEVVPNLAESVTPNEDATAWTITLPEDVVFHDGSELTADDVVYSLEYYLDPANAALTASNLTTVDPAGVKKVDDYTVEVAMNRPNAFFDANLTDSHAMVFPEGTTDFSHPVGTGPFMFESLDPGKEAVLQAFPDYRIDGLPKVDTLRLLSIDDTVARTNALIAGQVDVIAGVAYSEADGLAEQDGVEVLVSEGDTWVGLYMFTSGDNAGALEDPRVRQALRLLVDRQEILDNVFFGYGRLANDIYGSLDASYPDLEQRVYDPEQAKQLLADAGHSDLEVTLYTSDVTVGAREIATLFAEQAAAGGVTVNLENLPQDQYWSTAYMQQPFGTTYWGAYPLPVMFARNMAATGTTGETMWADEEWMTLYEQALETTDRDEVTAIFEQLQTILHERGGYIIPVFTNQVDASRSNVTGFKQSPIHHLGNFDFTEVEFTD